MAVKVKCDTEGHKPIFAHIACISPAGEDASQDDPKYLLLAVYCVSKRGQMNTRLLQSAKNKMSPQG